MLMMRFNHNPPEVSAIAGLRTRVFYFCTLMGTPSGGGYIKPGTLRRPVFTVVRGVFGVYKANVRKLE
jgi:hypothetical protein